MKKCWIILAVTGPAAILAAAGVGTGDIVGSNLAGIKFGFALSWAIVWGAILKYFLNEGLVRWQIATSTTIIQGWHYHISKYITYFFLVYFLGWCIVVAGGLIVSLSISTQAMVSGISKWQAGFFSALAVLGLVLTRKYKYFEKVMEGFVILMFVSFVYGAIQVMVNMPNMIELLKGFWPSNPTGSYLNVMYLIGGVGASLTILCFVYWVQEKSWYKPEHLPLIRVNLVSAYTITAIFNLSVLIIAASVGTEALKGARGVLVMAQNLEAAIGRAGYNLFLIGFWGAIFSSLISFFNAIPYLWCDTIALIRGLNKKERERFISMKNPWFWGFSIFLTVLCIVMLEFQRPFLFIRLFTFLGGIFMFFLSLILLFLNNREEMGRLKNKWWTNLFLGLNIILFSGYTLFEIKRLFSALL